ncbi:MAG TPA: serine/threonine-protein kinase [Noviherbaspirillum sp.]|uniref:serine/threonine-protein kinase n=1 Tax=Noviherbaspirillum sp. TaxID=1926288 RepID=UPI002B49AF1A|nr:serine/threonine-protein kinase [Noviherbaspirillum sp.]HJV85567.1 serine/threonine-protein kinase [Noviherbaspirillum sp.]
MSALSTDPASPTSPASPAISRAGRFYITRELGRGTVGCVYLGHDPVIGRDVAIKTFNPRLTPSDRNRFEPQFINEARAAGRLSHPHIITIYDASVENGTAYIAMEYLQGRGLNKALDTGHRFKPDEVASIVWRIADALNHAHQNQVIHRDIKPANIFMIKDDQPKLIDFGIARAPNRLADKFTDADDPATLLHGTNLVGTPNYMSPEQASGKPIDERTDIYSLGAVMYEMLVGRKPFHAESADKLLQQIITKAPPAPDELDRRVPAALSQIVMKAMSKRPEKRYQTAEQMALDIKRYLLRERRARRMNLALPPAVQDKPDGLMAGISKVAWFGYMSLAAAAVLAGFALWR